MKANIALRRAGLFLGLFILAGGCFTAVFFPAVSAALLLAPVPLPPQTTAPRAGPSPTRPTESGVAWLIMAQDSFHRPDQPFWGTASDGQMWSGQANRSRAFRIDHNQGVVQREGAPTTSYDAFLGKPVLDGESDATFALFPSSSTARCVFAIYLRWQNAGTWDRLMVTGSMLNLSRAIGGHIQHLLAQPFLARARVWYTLRFRATGSYLFASVWSANAPAPAHWLLIIHDAVSTTAGLGGLHFVLARGASIHVASFLETARFPVSLQTSSSRAGSRPVATMNRRMDNVA